MVSHRLWVLLVGASVYPGAVLIDVNVQHSVYAFCDTGRKFLLSGPLPPFTPTATLSTHRHSIERYRMQYALVKGVRQEAEPKLRGTCPNCDSEVVAKCGEQRIWHWSHLGKLECDRWWEPETEWHRAWKALFPQKWREFPHVADDGERHIADVKNDRGLVIELQHSPIDPEERLSRENFYKTMVWVVDGMRFERDLSAFREAVAEGIMSGQSLVLGSSERSRGNIPTLGSSPMPRVYRLWGRRFSHCGLSAS